jgi:hypothetical protein
VWEQNSKKREGDRSNKQNAREGVENVLEESDLGLRLVIALPCGQKLRLHTDEFRGQLHPPEQKVSHSCRCKYKHRYRYSTSEWTSTSVRSESVRSGLLRELRLNFFELRVVDHFDARQSQCQWYWYNYRYRYNAFCRTSSLQSESHREKDTWRKEVAYVGLTGLDFAEGTRRGALQRLFHAAAAEPLKVR